MKVMVVGSNTNPSDLPKFQEACAAVGEALARSGHDLIAGSDAANTADRWVVLGANRYEGRRTRVMILGIRSGGQRAFQDEQKQLGQIDFEWPINAPSWPRGHMLAARQADAIVPIGGGHRTYVVAMAANLIGRKVVPVSAFGGSGKLLFDELIESMKTAGLDQKIASDLNRPWDPVVAAAIVTAVESSLKEVQPVAKPIEEQSFVQIVTSLKTSHLVAVIGVCASALGGAFSLGTKYDRVMSKVEDERRSREIEAVKTERDRLKTELAAAISKLNSPWQTGDGKTKEGFSCASSASCTAGTLCTDNNFDGKYYCRRICYRDDECRNPTQGCKEVTLKGSRFALRVCNDARSSISP